MKCKPWVKSLLLKKKYQGSKGAIVLSQRMILCSVTGLLIDLGLSAAQAQNIVFDGTLGTARTVAGPNYVIRQQDGQLVSTNLFHSFARFNLNLGEAAIFQSAANIRNIFARVTGGSPSQINGLLTTQSSNVNLFLINPSGIVFGRNARLDIGGAARGSFFATTLDAIVFPSGGQFSAVNPDRANSLLTLVGDPSGFLASQRTPAAIAASGSRISVDQGQSLVLVGGNLALENAGLFVNLFNGGRIELAGVAAAGTVGLTSNGNLWRLNLPELMARADVSFSNGSFLDVVAQNGGSIAIYAANLTLLNSGLLSGIDANLGFNGAQSGGIKLNATGDIRLINSTMADIVFFNAIGNGGAIEITGRSLLLEAGSQLGSSHLGRRGNSGNITIQTRDRVYLDGGDPDTIFSSIISRVSFLTTGNSGNIQINTGALALSNGAYISSSILGRGDAGRVTINASEQVSLDGTVDIYPTAIFSTVQTGAIGNAGGIEINTGSLSLTNGAQLQALTRGRGNAGQVTINARDQVSLDGMDQGGLFSAVFSTVQPGAIGNAGGINISTGSLSLTNGGRLNTSTVGQGNAGQIIVNARERIDLDGVGITGDSSGILSSVRSAGVGNGGSIILSTGTLTVTNGAILTTNTLGRGNAGQVTVTAKDHIHFDGIGRNQQPSGAFSSVTATAIGNGGTINLNTGSLVISDGAQVATSSLGQGNAGNIRVKADHLTLRDRSQLTTETAFGQGGNINLSVNDRLILRRGSQISATAGTAQSGENGGNITIAAPFIIGLRSENSDITANAFTGRGGNINITANGIFGLRFQPQLTPNSDITASSEFGINGTVTLNLLSLDPSQGLVSLPVDVSDPANQISQACTSSRQSASSFVATGRGGLPQSPDDPLRSPAILPPTWVTATVDHARGVSSTQSDRDPATESIIEAQGWMVEPDGTISLVAQADNSFSYPDWQPPLECSVLESGGLRLFQTAP